MAAWHQCPSLYTTKYVIDGVRVLHRAAAFSYELRATEATYSYLNYLDGLTPAEVAIIKL
jgi:hypothetical protein